MNGADFKPSEEALTVQARAVLEALREGPKTTAQLRGVLGSASCPAARVMALRRAGHGIATQRSGRQALYVLAGGQS